MVEEANHVTEVSFPSPAPQAPVWRPSCWCDLWWYGAPVFTFEGPKVKDLWVLSDIHRLIGRIDLSGADVPEFTS
ncbi:hypothetical protein ACVWZZ_005961 [Bradyrhizobium sp. LM6.10]